MTDFPYRIVGLWEDRHWESIDGLLAGLASNSYMTSALQHMSADGQSRRSVLVKRIDLAEKIAKIGEAVIYYRVDTKSMSLSDHKKIGRMLFKKRIWTTVSASYKQDKSLNNATWEIADKAMAALVKLQCG